MKEKVIKMPDNFELKEIKDGKIIFVEKDKKVTYGDIIKELFPFDKIHYYIAMDHVTYENIASYFFKLGLNTYK